jgi:hypothetical protein
VTGRTARRLDQLSAKREIFKREIFGPKLSEANRRLMQPAIAYRA